MAHVVAVCAVAHLRADAGTVGVTAIDKRPVEGKVKVGRLGVYADVQADRKHHGGYDKAVYAYSQSDADYWAAELGRPLPPGFFGENLRVDGLDVNELAVGDALRIGTAELIVTGPRTPCQTFARWVGGADARGWVRRFTAAGRVGAYFSVAKAGRVEAGDEIALLPGPADAPSVREIFYSGRP